MIINLQNTTYSSSSPACTKQDNATRATTVFFNEKTVTTLINKHLCQQCYKKDSMIYPGSSFKLCISCDLENIKKTQAKTVDELIDSGICPQCHNKDSMLFKGSSFRLCVPCDIDSNLHIVQENKK